MDSFDNWADIVEINSDQTNENAKVLTMTKTLEPVKTFDHTNMMDLDNIKRVCDITILDKASMCAKNLKFQYNKKYNENNNEFKKWLLITLKWLYAAMLELSVRNSLSVNTNIQGVISLTITRNSYKFCEHGHMCKYNYEKNKKCHSHHFVYNLVYLDIHQILEHLLSIKDIDKVKVQEQDTDQNQDQDQDQDLDQDQDNKKEEPELQINEIQISINTITYVLNHMYDELTQLKISRPISYTSYINREFQFCPSISFRHTAKKASQGNLNCVAKTNSNIKVMSSF